MPTATVPAGPRNRFPGDVVLQLRADMLGFLTRIARQYGDVVPFRAGSSDYLFVNDPEFIREVLVTHAGSFIKGPALRRASDTLGQGLLTSEGDFHRRQRRLTQPALHPQRVAGYAEVMARIAARTRDAWQDGQSLDMHQEMMRLTLRIVAKTLFDAELEAQVDALGHAMDVTVNMFTRAMAPWGPLLNKLPLPSNFRFRAARQMLNATIDRLIVERRAEQQAGDVARNDLLSILVRARDTEAAGRAEAGPGAAGDGMSDTQLRDESLTLFTAGHETTANALTFTWHLLARNPGAEGTLHRELDAVLAGRLPTADDLDRLPYTRAVLAESMRLFPPAWAVAREATEDLEIAGRRVPEGSVILMSQWVTHRDPRWWPEPERFDPGRWMPAETGLAAGAQVDRPRYAYYPFGGGPRNCIGESFAWTEAVLVLATLAAAWRARHLDDRPLALQPTITLRPKRGVPMIVHRR